MKKGYARNTRAVGADQSNTDMRRKCAQTE